MEKLRCILGRHDYMLDTTFTVPVTDESRTIVLFHAPVAYGMVCVDCKKRKLRKSTNPYGRMATGIIEDAEMWLETGMIDAAAPQPSKIPNDAYESIELPPQGGLKLVVDNNG